MTAGSGPVAADIARTEVLFLAPPAPGAKHVDLVLPGLNLGLKGDFRFRIPAK